MRRRQRFAKRSQLVRMVVVRLIDVVRHMKITRVVRARTNQQVHFELSRARVVELNHTLAYRIATGVVLVFFVLRH